jgi:hypothetical protein
MVHKCKLCDYTSEVEAELMGHVLKTHTASADKFMS